MKEFYVKQEIVAGMKSISFGFWILIALTGGRYQKACHCNLALRQIFWGQNWISYESSVVWTVLHVPEYRKSEIWNKHAFETHFSKQVFEVEQ